MEQIKIILWATTAVAIVTTAFAWWSESRANNAMFDWMYEQMASMTEEQVDALVEESKSSRVKLPSTEQDGVVRVGTLSVVGDDALGWNDDGTFFKTNLRTGEEIPYEPTEAEIKQAEIGERAFFWSDVRRRSQVAVIVLLLVAGVFHLGVRYVA